MFKTLEEYKENLRQSSRYPYTYAYDMIRQARVMHNGRVVDSRADAAEWSHANFEGEERTFFLINLATAHIDYWAAVAVAEDNLNKALSAVHDLGKKEENNAEK